MVKAKPDASPWDSRIVGHDRVAPDQLVKNPLNFRTHPQRQRQALADAIAELGFIRSVTVNKRTGNLIDGHERVAQAIATQQPFIDVEYVDLSPEDERKALATLDPISEMAEVDPETLDRLLREVNTSSTSLSEMMADLAADAGLLQASGEVVEDEAPEPTADPVTKPGDLWLLGDHRLLCGDSTNSNDVVRVMNGELADLCFTSPPYGQQREYTQEATAGLSDWTDLMCGVFDNLPMAANGQVLVNLGLIHREGEWVPYWDNWITWMREQGWLRFGWYVWDQGFGLPGDWNGRFAPSHEFIFHFTKDAVRPAKSLAKKPENIKSRKKGASTMRGADGVCREFTSPEASAQPNKIPDSVVRVNRMHGGHDIDHPAIFPVELPAFVLRAWTGLAFEPFLGSGTTLIAAEQLGRRCYGIEISPAYCDVIVARWEKLTGKTATLAA